MRILIYGLNFAPELTGVGKYTGEMAFWLAAQGFDVRVVTGLPYYPAWQVAAEYCGKGYHIEYQQSVTIYRCPLWVTPQPTSRQRLLHLASFALASLPVLLNQARWHPDWVMVMEPTFLCVPGALVTARLAGSNSWLHVQDFELDAAFELGILPKDSRLHQSVSGLEKWLLAQFDRVSTISTAMLHRLRTKVRDPQRTLLVPNWIDTEQIYPLTKPSLFRQALGLAMTDRVILYAGNMSRKQGLEILLEVAQQLRHRPDVQFILCGDGTARLELEQQATREGLTQVRFLPLQPINKFNDLLNLADIHVLIQKEAAADLVMPSKLTGMLASGRPILATAPLGTAVADLILSAECGVIVPPGDSSSLVQALETMLKEDEQRQVWGKNGRAYAQLHCSQTQILSALAAHLLGQHNDLSTNSQLVRPTIANPRSY